MRHNCAGSLNLLTLSGIVPIRHVWYPRYRIARLTVTLKTTTHICGVLHLTAPLGSFVGVVILLAIMNLARRVRVQ